MLLTTQAHQDEDLEPEPLTFEELCYSQLIRDDYLPQQPNWVARDSRWES